MLKTELRKIFLKKQKGLAPAERAARSEQIADRFFGAFDLRSVSFLHCFLPIEKFNEIDTGRIFHRLWESFPQITTLVPRVDFHKYEIENLIYTPETELVQNQWLIREPAHDDVVEHERIDAVLVPLLCFDERGYRVGYGKGFYDRFLQKCRKNCLKIGLSYFEPVERIDDAAEHDVRLDFCVTPAGVFVARRP